MRRPRRRARRRRPADCRSNPGTKRARYTEYRPGAPPLDRTDDVLASHIVAFFALDLDRSVAAGPDLLDRVRAMEAEAEAEAAWRK